MFDFDNKSCMLCPRRCGGDRTKSSGVCRSPDKIMLGRAALHFYEEPCISGTRGSGAIFFSGCPLRCSYCQNGDLSKAVVGKTVSDERFREICFSLKAKGAHNINLVTPMHYAPYVRDALAPILDELSLPIIVNTGGYDSSEQIDCFENIADVYLPDYKYSSSGSAARYSSAPDYPKVALTAIAKMISQVGDVVLGDDGMIRSGVIVRHLVLPGARKESVCALDMLASALGTKGFYLSLMSQYTPQGIEGTPDRRLTTYEYETVREHALALGFDGFSQEKSSAKAEYTPDFDLTGV